MPAPSAIAIAREHSQRGAAEYVRYWFQTLNYATQTGDISPLRQASEPTCKACDAAITAVRDSYGDGGYMQGGTYTVRAVTSEEFGLDDQPMLSVSFDRTSRSGLGPDGQVRDSLPAASFVSCQVTLAWTGQTWKVATIVGDPLPS
jgi:hypothetical protein